MPNDNKLPSDTGILEQPKNVKEEAKRSYNPLRVMMSKSKRNHNQHKNQSKPVEQIEVNLWCFEVTQAFPVQQTRNKNIHE